MKEFKQIIGVLAQKAGLQIGEVQSVNLGKRTCVVVVDEIEKNDVRLQSIIDTQSSEFIVVPAFNSFVAIAPIENDSKETIVIATSEISQVLVKIGKTKFVIDQNGVSISQDQESLYTILKDLIAEISKIIVVQGTSPNVPALTKIETRFKSLLNGS